MKRLVTAVVLLFLFSAHARSGDWPQFRGPERDAKSTDTKLLSKWPENDERFAGARASTKARHVLETRHSRISRSLTSVHGDLLVVFQNWTANLGAESLPDFCPIPVCFNML